MRSRKSMKPFLCLRRIFMRSRKSMKPFLRLRRIFMRSRKCINHFFAREGLLLCLDIKKGMEPLDCLERTVLMPTPNVTLQV